MDAAGTLRGFVSFNDLMFPESPRRGTVGHPLA
jgi:hypothetical protein